MSAPPKQSHPSPSALFLPLAFRFCLAFVLVALHLALPQEPGQVLYGEPLYLIALGTFFLEALWEASRSLQRTGQAFAMPSLPWIRANLLLDLLLVALVIAFHGVDQERFATIYIFPVLASAFYLPIREILAIGLLSMAFHVASVLLFTGGHLPPFGRSLPAYELSQAQRTFILSFASLQISAATLVVVLIRKHLETLRSTLTRSEATVDALSTLYQRVFESMFSGLITLDLKGRVTSANPAAEAIFQRPIRVGTDLDSLGINDLTDHGSLPREQRFERPIPVPEGPDRIIGGNVAPLKDGEGRQTGHLILFQDLTDLKALEERTRLTERLAAVGELSSELAHELRNPIASVLGCVQILHRREAHPEMEERALTILRRESERVNELVTSFLDFTRPRPVRQDRLWLPAVLEEARDAFLTDPRNQGLDLILESVPELWIQGDGVCAQQVLGNLFSNARKALRDCKTPELQLDLRQRSDTVLLVVRDNGCGMDAERLRTVFLPFASGFEEGTGLGMTLVYQFVQRMGWDIQLASEPGRGTTVTLSIPIHP